MFSVDVILVVLGSEKTDVNGISVSAINNLDRERRRARRVSSVAGDSCQAWSVNVERDNRGDIIMALEAQEDG